MEKEPIVIWPDGSTRTLEDYLHWEAQPPQPGLEHIWYAAKSKREAGLQNMTDAQRAVVLTAYSLARGVIAARGEPVDREVQGK